MRPGQGPLPNLDLYMNQAAQLLSSSSVLQHSITSSGGNETSTGCYQNPIQISVVPLNVHTPKQAGYAYNQISVVPSNNQIPSQQVMTNPDNVSSAPTCSCSIDQFLDDIQLQSSPLWCHNSEPETIIAMQGTPEETRIAREIAKFP